MQARQPALKHENALEQDRQRRRASTLYGAFGKSLCWFPGRIPLRCMRPGNEVEADRVRAPGSTACGWRLAALLPTAYRPTACCLLPIAYCLLPHCLLPTARLYTQPPSTT
ncbi:hypothetical protein GGR16_000644 [Chelatococcus caeni]|uniref:Uncharacterized protein n=1 Tax=Chelatococcus caeni TaxID=1348468 RepID=A0A840BVY8_9HYPH|nr:hypothetical protein [Chelatococcus caeni]